MTTFTATPYPALREPFEVGQVQWLRKPGDGDREGLMAGFWHVTPEEMPAGTAHEFPFDETIYVVEGAMRIEVEAASPSSSRRATARRSTRGRRRRGPSTAPSPSSSSTADGPPRRRRRRRRVRRPHRRAELSLRGHSVVVLEARDRIGGRTWTTERLGRTLELGGTWVHWTQPHVWAELTRYGLEVVASPEPRRAYWWAQGERHEGSPDELLGCSIPATSRCSPRRRTWFPQPYEPLANPSLATVDGAEGPGAHRALELPEDQRELLARVLDAELQRPDRRRRLHAGDALVLARAGSWPIMFEACATYKLRAGTRALAEAIAADGDAEIRPGVRPSRADAGGDRDARRRRAASTAAAVVVTVPLHALRGLDVALSDGKRAAIEAGQASKGFKPWIRLRGEYEPFVALGGADWPITFLQTEY